MKRIVPVLFFYLFANLCLTSCQTVKDAGTSLSNTFKSVSPQTKQAVLVSVESGTAAAIAAAVKNESPAQIGNDAAVAALVSLHQQLQGNAGVAAVSAAGLAALKDVSAKQSNNQTLRDASVAAIAAIVSAPATPSAP